MTGALRDADDTSQAQTYISQPKLSVTSSSVAEHDEIGTSRQPSPCVSVHFRYAWLILFACFAMNFLTGVIDAYGVVYVELVDFFREGHASTAWPGAICGALTYLSGPLVSAVSDKFGLRVAGITGCLLATAGFAICFFANGIPVLCLGYGVLVGTGVSFIDIVASVAVATYFQDRMHFALAVSMIGMSVGSFVWPPVFELVMRAYTWQGAFLMFAAVSLQNVVFAALLNPGAGQSRADDSTTDGDDSSKIDSVLEMEVLLSQEEEATSAHRRRHDCEASDGSEMSRPCVETDEPSTITPNTSKYNLHLFCNVNYCLFLLACSMISATLSAYINGISDCVYRNGIPLGQAVFLLSVLGITGLAAQCILAAFGHRFNAVLVLMACTFSLAISYALIIPVTDNYLVYAVSSAILGIAGNIQIAVSPVLLAQLFGVDQMASAMGYSHFFKGVACLGIYPLQGGIYDWLGSYTPAWSLYIVLNVIATFTLGLIWWNLKRTSEPLRNSRKREEEAVP